MGHQRGVLRTPQGYMELPLPNEDLTGLQVQNASRINGKTKELVKADHSIEANAVREVYEEAGINITEKDLILVGVTSGIKENPICIAVQYIVKLNNTPKLYTVDDEFLQDDLYNGLKIQDK